MSFDFSETGQSVGARGACAVPAAFRGFAGAGMGILTGAAHGAPVAGGSAIVYAFVVRA